MICKFSLFLSLIFSVSAFAQTHDEFVQQIKDFFPQTELCPAYLPAEASYQSKSCLQGFQCKEKIYKIRAYCETKADGKIELLVKGLPLGIASSMRFDQARWDKMSGLIILNYFDMMFASKQFTPQITGLDHQDNKLVIHYQILKDSSALLEGQWILEKSEKIFGQFSGRHNVNNTPLKSETWDAWIQP